MVKLAICSVLPKIGFFSKLFQLFSLNLYRVQNPVKGIVKIFALQPNSLCIKDNLSLD
jgi:hypothetical protein